MPPDEPLTIKDQILTDIRSGQVSMRPKIIFTARLVLLLILVLIIFVISVVAANLIIATIMLSHRDLLLGFGSQGIVAFIEYFPWYLLLCDLALLLVFGHLIRRFKFGYHKPAVFVLIGVAVFVGLLALALERATIFNEQLSAHRELVPSVARNFYQVARQVPTRGSGICRCQILAIHNNTLVVKDIMTSFDFDGDTDDLILTITLPLDNPRATTTGLRVGDVIFIAGIENEKSITAFGVRSLSGQ